MLLALVEDGAEQVPSPAMVAGDKGYASAWARGLLSEQGIEPLIPTKSDEPQDPAFDRALYRERNLVERLFNRFKQFRRLATRYEKRKATYLAFLTIAAILIWLRLAFADTP